MHSSRFSLKPNQKLRTGLPGYQTDSGTPSLKSGGSGSESTLTLAAREFFRRNPHPTPRFLE